MVQTRTSSNIGVHYRSLLFIVGSAPWLRRYLRGRRSCDIILESSRATAAISPRHKLMKTFYKVVPALRLPPRSFMLVQDTVVSLYQRSPSHFFTLFQGKTTFGIFRQPKLNFQLAKSMSHEGTSAQSLPRKGLLWMVVMTAALFSIWILLLRIGVTTSILTDPDAGCVAVP